MHVIEPGTWRTQPWRNGAGVTHELVRWPDTDAFVVRISVADVTSPAPFSTFAGLERWLYLLAGGPVTLALDGGDVVLAEPGDGIAFAGEARVAATAVAGPSRDLNFMVRSGRAVRSEIVTGPTAITLAGAAVAVFAIAGPVAVDHLALAPHACAWTTDTTAIGVTLGAGARAAILVVSPSVELRIDPIAP